MSELCGTASFEDDNGSDKISQTLYKVIGDGDGNALFANVLSPYSASAVSCTCYTRPEPITVAWEPDTDHLLKNAVRAHAEEFSFESKDGTAHFCEDGSLVVKCNLPCGNEICILVEGNAGDAMQLCDIAMKRLEEMKGTITSMQEQVFELSLSQKIDHD